MISMYFAVLSIKVLESRCIDVKYLSSEAEYHLSTAVLIDVILLVYAVKVSSPVKWFLFISTL